jgi:prepilin-type N-terminal cleavage/methylation domain-containing protein
VNGASLLTRLLLSSRRSDRKAKQFSMKIRTSSKLGFTLVEIMIVVAIIGLLAAIAIPNFVRARTTSQMNACINNLRQIDGAKQQWALENKQLDTVTPGITDIGPYLKNSVVCPAGGNGATFGSSYTMGTVAAKPACQIVPGTHVLPADTSS